MKKNKISFLSIPYLIVLLILVVIPIFMMILYSFQDPNSNNVFTISFSITNYTTFLSEKVFILKMFKSIYIALIVTIVTFIIGYPIAYIISSKSIKYQALTISLISAPMLVNLLIKVLSIKQLFLIFSPSLLGTNFAIIFGLSYIYLPFMVLPIYNNLIKLDKNLISASYDLGANKIKTFIKITLPLTIPGIMSGVLMVLLPSATSLVIPKHLGNGEMLIGTIIESAILTRGQFGEGSSMGIVLTISMLIILLIITQINRIGVRRRKNEKTKQSI